MRSPLPTALAFLLPSLLLAPGPVRSAETVLGVTNAQRCYEYALAGTSSRMAIDVCTDAIADETLDQDDLAATYCNRGLLHTRSKRHDRALADFDRALLLDPALVHALINRGNLHLRTENFERALEDYDSAIFYSQGRSALAFYNRSLLHERAGRMTEAREDLLRAIQLQPESREYREALATLE
ncbi:MAG: tetratricopeptide repeat protein [Pseudomonadales bacterium]|jgi:tetratricopeptide (TPR) repeat protein|nr:tetratricopeptide repeat protein [Pseudomonadales bacterium]